MKKIQVPAVYINADKISTKEEKERLERILSKLDYKEKFVLPENKLLDTIQRNEWYDKTTRTGQRRKGNPHIILTTFDWEDKRNDPKAKSVYKEFIPGRFPFADYRDRKQLRKEKGVICNSGYEIHTSFGCLHSCSYCHVGNALTIMLDVEKFIDNLKVLTDEHPWQKLYKFDNQGDVLTLEPEYGITKKLVEFFSKTDKTLMLYTKSDNVDFLLDLEHKGQTKVCWTMSCDEVADTYEHGAATLEERITAAKKCQDAGYEIRFRFSPIIPVKDWRKKNKKMMERIFSEVNPEIICLETLCHITKKQYQALFTNLAYTTKKEITEYELFSHVKRKRMYEFFIKEITKLNPDVDIAICLETEEMWDSLGKLLKGEPNNFRCCCGAQCD